jgi:putative ABC transport system ATP-binding protein
MISIQNVSKTYQQTGVPVLALQNVSLGFEKGEFVAIVGPSGCGKTTLLNLMGGLDRPDKGEIWIENQNLNELSDSQLTDFRLHHIGFVFQNFNLIPVLSVFENIALILELQNLSIKTIRERVNFIVNAVGLSDKINTRPAQLSGGQQQRVAIARALVASPKFIIADEPTANLDSKNAESLLNLMQELNDNQDVTFIFSTHDSRIINRAKRVVELEDGKAKAQG